MGACISSENSKESSKNVKETGCCNPNDSYGCDSCADCDACYVGDGCCAPSALTYIKYAHVNRPDFDPVIPFSASDNNVAPHVHKSSSHVSDLSTEESDEGRKRSSVHRKRHSEHHNHSSEEKRRSHRKSRQSVSKDTLATVSEDTTTSSAHSASKHHSIFNNSKENEAATASPPVWNAVSHTDSADPKKRRLTRVLFSEDGQLSVVDVDNEQITARIHKVTANVDLNSTDYRKELLSHVEALECEDNNGNRPLHIAAYLGHLKHLNVLLELNADINARNNAGNTPLHLALSTNHFDVAVKLKKKGAKDSIKNLAGFPASKGSRGTSTYATAALLSAINENHLLIALNMCETLELEHVDLGELIRCKDYAKRTLSDIWTDQHEEKINNVISRLEDDIARAQSPNAKRGGKGYNNIERVISDDTFVEEGFMTSMTHEKTEYKDKKDPFGSMFGLFCF